MSHDLERLTAEAREDLIADVFRALSDDTLDRPEAAELVATVVGDALELAAGCLGAPDTAQELAGLFGEKLTKAIAEAVKPNLERLHERREKALKAGNAVKAARILGRIERTKARRGDAGDDDGGSS